MVKRKSVASEGYSKANMVIRGTHGPSMEANVSKSPSGPTSTSLLKSLVPSFSSELIYMGIHQCFSMMERIVTYLHSFKYLQDQTSIIVTPNKEDEAYLAIPAEYISCNRIYMWLLGNLPSA